MEAAQMLGLRGPEQSQVCREADSRSTGRMVLSEFSLASGHSALVRTGHEGGAAAWITGNLVLPGTQRSQ